MFYHDLENPAWIVQKRLESLGLKTWDLGVRPGPIKNVFRLRIHWPTNQPATDCFAGWFVRYSRHYGAVQTSAVLASTMPSRIQSLISPLSLLLPLPWLEPQSSAPFMASSEQERWKVDSPVTAPEICQ